MISFFRLPSADKQKTMATIIKEQSAGITCCAADCKNPISTFTGPGANRLCREHQLQQREYGGLGRLDRPWTFSRDWSCGWCGYSPKDDPWFTDPPIPWDSEVHMHSAMSATLVGDHSLVRKVDGGSHGRDNVKTLCQICNAKKGALYKDFDSSTAKLAS